MTDTIAVVGTGVAGATAAQTLRTEGFTGRVVLIGHESALPYRRPVLSKELLAGTTTRERSLLQPENFWGDNNIELHTGTTVTALDGAGHRLTLSSGEKLDYDAVLLATGGQARQLNYPNAGSRVFTLRNIDDVVPLRAALDHGGSLLVIGAGLIGCEVAATASQMGLDVTVLEAAPVPLSRIVPAEIAQMYMQLHSDNGVEIVTGVKLAALVEVRGEVRAIATDGSTWRADAALVAVGSTPNTALAEAAGLHVDNGIIVDERYHTSVSGVYAAGDVANSPNPVLGGRQRSEHWNDARAQGEAAAKSILGQSVQTPDAPWGWSTQYGNNLQFAGWTRHDDDYLVAGDITTRNFTALALRDRRLVGAIAMGRPKDIRTVRTMIHSNAIIDADNAAQALAGVAG
ncbi:FAD-dependent oxidoreductase [Skermania sp. ID1734]|uniref:NAD(P)/FAD-dependent oxidoreductase n=1 Tax=Skermania sp. ID1734 TaxID=2597516 RepID=UPI00117ED6AC|nr:FAD-dependent oxidoreductase [Skermania sp. ID1734]TSD99981.1 FAD-dependent oxidoreductase [Skermania sp. ID1734]